MTEFKIGDKVKLEFPGHAASRFDTAEIVSLEAPAHPELFVIKFQNGLICNCQPERLKRV